MKVAILTDTHFGFKKGNKAFHQYFKSFYDDVFFPYLIKNNIKTVIHLGDSFDNRKAIDYWSLQWSRDTFYDALEKLGITLYNIVGNHDIYYRNSNKLNSVDYLLSEYDNVVKISSPTEFTIGNLNVLMLPWITPENEQDAFRMIQNTNCSVVMGHLELSGFRVNSKLVMEHGLDPKQFQKFKKVFSGHYHTRSNDGTVFYLGNTYQMFWSDYKDVRGFTVFDTETLKHEHVNNPYEIFKIINYTDNTSIDVKDYIGCIVKLVVKEKQDKIKYEKFLDVILSENLLDLKIVEETIINNVEDDDFVGCEDTLSLLKRYVDESETGLNKSKIKNLINSIYQESYQI